MWKLRKEGYDYTIRCGKDDSLDEAIEFLKHTPDFDFIKHSYYRVWVGHRKVRGHTDRIIIPGWCYSLRMRWYFKKHNTRVDKPVLVPGKG